MIVKSIKLMQPLDSCVGLNFRSVCIELVYCAFSTINDEDIIYVTGVEQYLFGIYEGSDVDVF